jgi:hypothetical protein
MANLPPHQTPDGGGNDEQQAPPQASTGVKISGLDPTLEPGNYTDSLFGVAIPQGTGSPGSAQGHVSGDSTLEVGQLWEGLSGLGPDAIANTGSPGSMGAQNVAGGSDTVTYTRPGSAISGTNKTDTVQDNISGHNDWTQAIDGSYGGGPQLPGVAGNMPDGTGAGGGRVLRGGRAAG